MPEQLKFAEWSWVFERPNVGYFNDSTRTNVFNVVGQFKTQDEQDYNDKCVQ